MMDRRQCRSRSDGVASRLRNKSSMGPAVAKAIEPFPVLHGAGLAIEWTVPGPRRERRAMLPTILESGNVIATKAIHSCAPNFRPSPYPLRWMFALKWVWYYRNPMRIR